MILCCKFLCSDSKILAQIIIPVKIILGNQFLFCYKILAEGNYEVFLMRGKLGSPKIL